MGIVIPLGTVILAALVHATLQLGQGCLLLLYHASLGKFVRAKTRNLVDSFTAGVGIILFLSLGTASFVISSTARGSLAPEILAAIVGVLVALAIIAWFFYYRKGQSTELWLPKTISKFINRRASEAKNNTEAFLLGVLSCFAEMPFTIALILVAANSVAETSLEYRWLMFVLYILLVIMPLIIMRLAVRRGQTVVDIQKWRVKNKNFLRIISGFGFLTLAIFVLVFKLMGIR